MRVGVIRGDLPGPLFLADLEPTSQTNFSVDPPGQTRYVARPDLTNVTAVMTANAFAGFSSTGNITLNVTINAGNQTLRAKTASAAGFSVILIPTGTYTSLASLIAAANPVLLPFGMALEVNPVNSARLVLYSLTGGPGSHITIDTTANGSTFNGATAGNFGAAGGTFTMPAASAFITATLPVGGPLDVRATTIRTQLGPAPTDTQVAKIADSIAPQFIETEVAVKCYQVGNLADLRSANFNPDPNRIPALSNGAAVTIVQDDGNTAFSASVLAPVPNISGAAFGGGNLTITGTGLGNSEFPNSVKVKLTSVVTGAVLVVSQRKFVSVGGSVSATSVVVPTTQIPGMAAGDKVQLLFMSLASNVFTTT